MGSIGPRDMAGARPANMPGAQSKARILLYPCGAFTLILVAIVVVFALSMIIY